MTLNCQVTKTYGRIYEPNKSQVCECTHRSDVDEAVSVSDTVCDIIVHICAELNEEAVGEQVSVGLGPPYVQET